MRLTFLVSCCFIPFITAFPHPAGDAAATAAQLEVAQSKFLNTISNYLYGAYELLQLNQTQAKPIIQKLEQPPLSNLISVLNIQLQEAGIEPSYQNITELGPLAKITGELKLADIGGYLENLAGRLGGVTLLPNNVTNVTLAQAASQFKPNPKLRLR